ncbi:hypothetical protein [Singulisphaera sp. PoT]|uniref:hypothetical protein n=1 Tax=Singulisphaera sp. PoT TaxID=3411797 RepID=UPI003BF569C8
MSNADKLAEIVKHAPHSFQLIRAQSSLKLSDAEFATIIRENPSRFASVYFAKKKPDGTRVSPARPGVKLITV